MPPRWLDLAKGRLRRDRLCRNGSARLSSPELATPRAGARGPRFAHSSRAKKVSPLPSSAALRPEVGASAITFGLQIAIEAAMVAGSDSQGE